MNRNERLAPFVGRVVLDEEFRASAMTDPEGAARSIGVRLTDGEISRFQQWDPDRIDMVAGPFQDWLAALIAWLIEMFGRGW